MATIDYEALIEKRRGKGDDIEQRKQANKLAEIARNLESLHKLAEAAAEEHAPEQTKESPLLPDTAEEKSELAADSGEIPTTRSAMPLPQF